MRALLAGESTPVLTAAFLTALRMKGETVDELTGFARAMRAAATAAADIGDGCRPLLDTCGTGGDGTFHVQHFDGRGVCGGGRGSPRGQARQPLDFQPMRQRGCAGSAGRSHGHRARDGGARHSRGRNRLPLCARLSWRDETRAAGAAGTENADRVQFSGALTNPARAEIQVAGTWSEEAAEKIAGALARLGLHRGYVVHGRTAWAN